MNGTPIGSDGNQAAVLRLSDARNYPRSLVCVGRIVDREVIRQDFEFLGRRILIDHKLVGVRDVVNRNQNRRFILAIDRIANRVRSRRTQD